MASVFKSAYAFYNRKYQARPILTICTTNAILAGISDTLTQKYLAPTSTSHDAARSSLNKTDRFKEEMRNLGYDIEQSLHEPQKTVAAGVAQAKSSLQSAQDKISDTSAKEKATHAAQSTKDKAQQQLNDSVRSAKDKVKTGADHAKSHGEQTVKEIKERGVDGAKDMGEGLKKMSHEMTDMGKNAIEEHIPAKKGQPAQQSSKDVADSAKDKASDVAQSAKDRASDTASSAKDKVQDSAQLAKEKGQSAQQSTKDAVHSAKDKASDVAQSAKDNASDAVSSAKDKVQDTVQSTKDKVEQQAGDSFQHANETAKAAADHLKTNGEQVVKEAKERGFEGTKDMGEGLKNMGQEILPSVPGLASGDTAVTGTPPLDFTRMGRFMFYNFSVAPLMHTWYTFLDKNFPINNATAPGAAGATGAGKMPAPSSKLMRTVTPAFKRMVTDQTLFAPVGLALLFSGLTILEGGGVEEIKDKLNNNYISTLKANYAVWPLVQLVNFSVMPLQLRLPFVSVVGIAWNAYLSLVNSRGRPAAIKDDQQQSVMAMAS
ncbi:hypothetical protein BGZ98_006965 [Dissophora globulifera]|nr:hypothetical protein BGZ98_006965 [Dissophora globulifera]